MTHTYQYLLLTSFLFEPYQAFLLTHGKAQPLWTKSKLKYSFYTVKRFYKDQLIPLFLFLCACVFLISQNLALGIYVLYLCFLPFIIPFTSHYAHLFFLLFFPCIFSLLKLHFLICLFYFLTFLYFYCHVPLKPNFFERQDHLKMFRLILPLVLIVHLFTQNHTLVVLQQIFILSIFVMIINLESCLTETKTILEISRNRYILWHIKSPCFDFKFLNSNNRFSLLTQSLMILYLSIITVFISKDIYSFLILITCFIYYLFYEFDKMIYYKFFNQSIFYDDIISRFIFSQIIHSGISFYLLYLGIGEVLFARNLTFKYFDLFKFIFIIWYSVWILFFYTRFDKKLKGCLRKFTLVFILIVLTSCAKKEVLSHTLVDERVAFTGNMIHENKQSIILTHDSGAFLKVKNGDHIKKGDPLLVINYQSAIDEIKRLNFQIEQLERKESLLKQKLNHTEDEVTQNSLNVEIVNIQEERKILKFDKNLIRTHDTILADFPGTVLIENNALELVSDQLVLRLSLNEHEYRYFKEIKDFEIINLNEEVISKAKEYDVFFKDDAYQIIFKPIENECYIHQTLIIKPKNPLLFAPKTFITEKDGELFAKTDATEVMVSASFNELKDGYYIHSGLKEGDIILSYDHP